MLSFASALMLAACSTGEQPDAPANTADPTTAEPTPTPNFSGLDGVLADRTGGHRAVLVTNADGGELYAEATDEQLAPASCMKILTYLALASSVDVQQRFTTSVVRSGNEFTLVAGGDTMLAPDESNATLTNGHAGLGTLAGACVESMQAAKTEKGKFPVYLDTTLYTGEGLNPGWEKGDVDSGQIAAISPIALLSHTVPGKYNADGSPARPEDAGAQAHQVFVDALNKAGEGHGYIFERKERRARPAGAVEVASVESATVLHQAQHMMLESDNALAEALARNAAVAQGKAGTGEQAQHLVREAVAAAGVDVGQLVQADVCGLSLQDRVSARILVQALAQLLAHERHDELLEGFPVAGRTGTLKNRFAEPEAAEARDYVRAKTGTLFTVVSLAGYTTRPDGTRLIFALILNDADTHGGLVESKKAVDAAAAVIAGRAPGSVALAEPSQSTAGATESGAAAGASASASAESSASSSVSASEAASPSPSAAESSPSATGSPSTSESAGASSSASAAESSASAESTGR